jgi:plasmid stabilization system protein ParE
MADKLITAREAQQDIADAYGWYEDRRIGLGEEFLSCVDACIQGIARMPELHPIVHDTFRRALVRRFPYAIFYEHANGTVIIYGVFHTSMDPAKWRRRLSK